MTMIKKEEKRTNKAGVQCVKRDNRALYVAPSVNCIFKTQKKINRRK